MFKHIDMFHWLQHRQYHCRYKVLVIFINRPAMKNQFIAYCRSLCGEYTALLRFASKSASDLWLTFANPNIASNKHNWLVIPLLRSYSLWWMLNKYVSSCGSSLISLRNITVLLLINQLLYCSIYVKQNKQTAVKLK